MKSILFVLLISVICGCFPSTSFFAYAEQIYWAKVESADVYFYALANENSPLFILPASYFVKLTGENEQFYSAEYKDICGYVKKEAVTPMDGTPSSPYFNETFRVFVPSGTGLYATTQMDEQYKVSTIPYLCDTLEYYGTIVGDEAIPDKSNLWYYCRFENENLGYVYSSFCDKLASPSTNTETFPPITNISFKSEEGVSALSSTAMAFIIIGVSLPCLIVLYLLMKPNMMTKRLPREKEKYKARRRRDYFEFDQSDLN